MKSILKIQIACFFLISFYGCSESEKAATNNNDMNIKGMTIVDKSLLAPRKTRGMEDRYNLFSFSDNAELENKLKKALIDINGACKYEMSLFPNKAKISMDIEIKKDKAFLPEWRYFDSSGKLTDRYIFNPTTFYYDHQIINNTPADPNALCEGGRQLKSCDYGNDYGDCVVNASIQFVITSLQEGKTPTITVTNSLTQGIICGTVK